MPYLLTFFPNIFAVFQLHPDKHLAGDATGNGNGGTSSHQSDQQRDIHDKFVAVNMAYEILSKPKSKEIYDLSLSRDPADPRQPNYGYHKYRSVPCFSSSVL